MELGSKGALDNRVFAQRVVEMTICRVVPAALRACVTNACGQAHKQALEAAAIRCEQELMSADAAAAANAYAAADAAAAAAAAAADAANARDRVMTQFAEWVVEILIDMGAPGCRWLVLAPQDATA